MSDNGFFFNFSDSAGKEGGGSGGDEGANSWLFGGEGDNGGGGGDPAAAVESGEGGDGFGLPVLKGQLFGTDGAASNGDETSLSLSQLMAEPNTDFPFDLSYGATSSGLFQQDSTVDGKGKGSNTKSASAAAVAAAAVAEKAKSAAERGRRSAANPSKIAKDDDRNVGSSRNDASRKETSLTSNSDLRRKPTDDNGANARSKDDSCTFGSGSSFPALEGSNSPKSTGDSVNHKRVKWSGDVSGAGGAATSLTSRDGKSKLLKGNSESTKHWDMGGAGDSGQKGPSSKRSGGGGRGLGGFEIGGGKQQTSSKKSQDGLGKNFRDFAPSTVQSKIGSGSLAGGTVDRQPSPQQKSDHRSAGIRQTDNRSPGTKQPLIVPPVLQQQRQQQDYRFGWDPSRPQPPTPRTTDSRKTSALKTTAARRNGPGGVIVGRSGDDDSDAGYHLFRPVATFFDRVAAELKPVRVLENALDQIIDHLDELDAKADAKLEELMLKKNNYLEATRKMQSAFK